MDEKTRRASAMVIILMGVTGSGKTTLGRLLADQLGWDFHDGDDYHSAENIRKMSAGIPLTDEDREDWLHSLSSLVKSVLEDDQSIILACSALKQRYRDVLKVDPGRVRFVYLKGSPEQIRARVQSRKGHYMGADMVASQFDALEEPVDALTLHIDQSPDDLLAVIIDTFHLDVGGKGERRGNSG